RRPRRGSAQRRVLDRRRPGAVRRLEADRRAAEQRHAPARRSVLAAAPLDLERLLERQASRRQTVATFETNSSGAIGLVRWSLQPAARPAAARSPPAPA